MSPPRNVPVVIMTVFDRKRSPHVVTTPSTSPLSTSSFSTVPCLIRRLSCSSSLFFIRRAYFILSACALDERTAGPFLVLSTLNWIPVASIFFPISPPRASISFTRCPFPRPPTAGLHDMNAIWSRLMVRRRVFAPIRDEARAASHPAWPAPITITSKASISTCINRHIT